MINKVKEKMEEIIPVWNYDAKSAELLEQIKPLLAKVENPSEKITSLKSQADVIAKKTVWIICGDIWAYDIGYGGLDHVIASCENVKAIVMDREVSSSIDG